MPVGEGGPCRAPLSLIMPSFLQDRSQQESPGARTGPAPIFPARLSDMQAFLAAQSPAYPQIR